MSSAAHPRTVDRTGWPNGPWDDEPDRVDFKTEAGFPAIALRSSSGYWCGYVAAPPGHPAHPDSGDDVDIAVHGTVTYGGKCSGDVCHVPEPGEPDDVYWIGFDFAHSGDARPSKRDWDDHPWSPDGRTQYWGPNARYCRADEVRGVYRDIAYVRAECEKVGQQLAAMVSKAAT
jgi:hypothetical protein